MASAYTLFKDLCINTDLVEFVDCDSEFPDAIAVHFSSGQTLYVFDITVEGFKEKVDADRKGSRKKPRLWNR